jgi:hypothetical protein
MLQIIGISVGLFIALLGGLEMGRWLRRRRGEVDAEAIHSAADEGVAFAVLGLLIAFTFTSSASRFDERRKLINDQANALGTAWLRVDLLPEGDREPIRKGMREWVKLTLDVLPKAAEQEPQTLTAHLRKAQQLQDETWKAAVSAVDRNPKHQYASLVLPPINDWIDLSSTRLQLNNRGLPPLVMPTLIVLSVLASILVGFGMAKTRRSMLHMLSFAGAIAFSLYVIADLNQPRAGLIRVDSADDAMMQLYDSMTSSAPALTNRG